MAVDKKILINGCGISGRTLAFWLGKRGFEPEIVEKRPDLADEGYLIDFYGPGFDVAEKMGIIVLGYRPSILCAATSRRPCP